MKLKKIGVLTTALALTASMAVLAAPAGAATVLTCAAPSGSVTFSPGLSSTAVIQTTTFNLPIKSCTGTKGVTGGTSNGKSKGTKPQSCKTFASAGGTTTTVTIKWSNKKTSSAKLATTIVKGAPNTLTASVSGKISSGLFAGKTLKTKVKVTINSGGCVSATLKTAKLTGLSKVTIG